MRNTISVLILCNHYLIMDSPEDLKDGDRACAATIDHDQRVIWIQRSLRDRARAVALAVSQAWRERLDAVPVIQESLHGQDHQ